MIAIESIPHEYQFKSTCDALLRHEFGHLLQTYAGKGRDGGIDAEFTGAHKFQAGRWVFQYKFFGQEIDQERARRILLRSFIRGRQSTSSKKVVEFEKVAALKPQPDAYVIVTNAAATVGMVDKLRRAWSQEFSGKLLVWDRSTLNIMLRGRSFLARLWDGAKEAHCVSDVVAPIYQDLTRFLSEQTPATMPGYCRSPLWPIELRHTQVPVAGDSFLSSISWRYAWQLTSSCERLMLVEMHPLFRYASAVAFPRSFRGFKQLLGGVSALYDRLLVFVGENARSLESLPALTSMAGQFNCDGPLTALAFVTIETAWGFTSHYPNVRGDKLLLGRTYIYEGPIPADLMPILDGEVRRLRAQGVPKDIESLRQKALVQLRKCWAQLWWPAQLGIDYEHGEQPDAPAQSSSRREKSTGQRKAK